MVKRGGAVAELVDNLPPETPAERDITVVEDAILAACDAGDDSVTWDVRYYKIDKNAGNAEEYLFSVLPNEMDGVMDRIRDTEGTGAYRMRAYQKLGGRNQIFKQHDFRVRAPAKPATPVQDNRPSEMSAVLSAMKEQGERNERLIRELMGAKPAPTETRNPLDDLEKLTTVMKNLMPATVAPAAGTQPDLTGVFVKGVEFAEKIVGDRGGDGGGEGDGIWGIAKEIIRNLPAVAAIAQAQQGQRLQRPLARQPARQPQVKHQQPPAPASHQPPPQQQPQGNAQEMALREAVEYLLTRAQRGSDPGFYADWIVENMEAETITAILGQPDPVAAAMMLDPRIAPFKQWFDDFIAELRNIVNSKPPDQSAMPDATGPHTAPNIPDGNSRRGTGNGGDVANHVTRGQGWEKTARH